MTAVDARSLLQTLREHEPDWAVRWLIDHADPELWAPRQFVIVDELTKGSPTLATIWRTIYRLWLFYRPINRRRFGFRMIAAAGGVGRGHLSSGIRTLHKLGLLTVIGLSNNDKHSDRWEYDIDPAQLEAMSVRLMRSRLSSGQLVVRRRPFDAQQRDLFAALELAPDEAILTPVGATADEASVIEFPKVAPMGATLGNSSSLSGAATAEEQAPVGACLERLAPTGAIFASEGRLSGAHLASVGATAVPELASRGAAAHQGLAPMGAAFARGLPQVAPMGADLPGFAAPNQAIRPPLVPEEGDHVAHDLRHLAPTGAPGWMDHEHEGKEREGAAPSAATLTPDSLALIIEQTLAQRLPSLMAAALQQNNEAGALTHTAGGHTSLTDEIPAPPCPEEPELQRGLLTTWRIVSRQDVIPERDLAQLEMLVNRYHDPTDSHAAYWLCRVMWEADRANDGTQPIRLRLITSYLRRMEEAGEFSSRAMEDKEYGKGHGGPERDPASRRGEPAGLGEPRAPRRAARPAAIPPASLPSEIAEHWVIETWRRFAGPDAVILVEQAQQLVGRVTRQDVWEAVLANWREKYKRRANWVKFDGLLDWYTEASKAPAVPADEFDPNGPPASASVIDNHPSLDREARGAWYRRFHAAGDNKAARQAVIKRFLAEHPIDPSTEPND